MDKSIQKLVNQGMFGAALTQEDWKTLLEDATEAANLAGVFTAFDKLNSKPTEEVLEDLLLVALCNGECFTALKTAVELKRKLNQAESLLLLEGAILLGKVEGLLDSFPVTNNELLSIIHTSITIAACRSLMKKRNKPFPVKVNLYTWPNAYTQELVHFDVRSEYKDPTNRYIQGLFIILKKESLHKLLGALLVDDIISKEAAEIISAINF